MGVGGRAFGDRDLQLRESGTAALDRVEPRREVAGEPRQFVGLDAVLARHRTQFEQPRLCRLQPLGIIFHRAHGFVQFRLGVVGVDNRAIKAGERFGKQRMVAREPVEPPRRAAQQRRTARAALERFEDRREVAGDLLALLHRRTRLGEFDFLARLWGEPVQFGDAMFEPFAVARRLAHRRLRRREPRLGGAPRRMRLSHRRGVDARIGVEQRAMPGGREQAAIVVLTVNLDQMPPTSRSSAAEQGWSLRKARLPPSALSVRRISSGSPGSSTMSLSASRLASGVPGAGGAKLAVTCARSLPCRTSALSARIPSARPSASSRIDLPAPVSPVSTPRPASKSRSSRSISTMLAMDSAVSMARS